MKAIYDLNRFRKKPENDKLTKNENAELYFIFLPYVSRFSSYDYDPNYEIYSKVISMVKDLNIKYIDTLYEIKSKHNDPLSMFQLRKYQHLNFL